MMIVFLLALFAVVGRIYSQSKSFLSFKEKQSLTQPYTANIDYQIHSNNDLSELYQLLLKGARRFKFDPHYIDSSHPSCAGKKECLLLNHDKPIKLSTYNTSDELLHYFTTSEVQSSIGKDYISIALCFKSAPDYCSTNSTAFSTWLQLVDDFYNSANSLVSTTSLNLEFILDGDAKPMRCLEGRWPLWNSVWIVSNNDPINAQAFYSNDLQHDYYRYQILNNPENISNWQWMAQNDIHYGKFSTSLYPYQLWEVTTIIKLLYKC
jgi:hypothetical protein